MQTATSETESKSLDLSICVHHYTLRAPCPEGQGIKRAVAVRGAFGGCQPPACEASLAVTQDVAAVRRGSWAVTVS